MEEAVNTDPWSENKRNLPQEEISLSFGTNFAGDTLNDSTSSCNITNDNVFKTSILKDAYSEKLGKGLC